MAPRQHATRQGSRCRDQLWNRGADKRPQAPYPYYAATCHAGPCPMKAYAQLVERLAEELSCTVKVLETEAGHALPIAPRLEQSFPHDHYAWPPKRPPSSSSIAHLPLSVTFAEPMSNNSVLPNRSAYLIPSMLLGGSPFGYSRCITTIGPASPSFLTSPIPADATLRRPNPPCLQLCFGRPSHACQLDTPARTCPRPGCTRPQISSPVKWTNPAPTTPPAPRPSSPPSPACPADTLAASRSGAP